MIKIILSTFVLLFFMGCSPEDPKLERREFKDPKGNLVNQDNYYSTNSNSNSNSTSTNSNSSSNTEKDSYNGPEFVSNGLITDSFCKDANWKQLPSKTKDLYDEVLEKINEGTFSVKVRVGSDCFIAKDLLSHDSQNPTVFLYPKLNEEPEVKTPVFIYRIVYISLDHLENPPNENTENLINFVLQNSLYTNVEEIISYAETTAAGKAWGKFVTFTLFVNQENLVKFQNGEEINMFELEYVGTTSSSVSSQEESRSPFSGSTNTYSNEFSSEPPPTDQEDYQGDDEPAEPRFGG